MTHTAPPSTEESAPAKKPKVERKLDNFLAKGKEQETLPIRLNALKPCCAICLHFYRVFTFLQPAVNPSRSGKFPGISGNFREFPGISGNFREFPGILDLDLVTAGA